MWHSQSIVSLKATKSILQYICVSPFQGINRSQYIYYFSILVLFEALFMGSFYIKFFYNKEIYIHWDEYDTLYFVEHITWFLMGQCFSIAIILSLCSRSAQQKLIKRVIALDARLESQLKINLSFRRLNIEFIVVSACTTFYMFTYYLVESICNKSNASSLIYNFSITLAADFFCIFSFYTVYWARVFVNRSKHIMDTLKVTISQRHISKQTLTIVMELIKLLFDVRESIQNAFGSMLGIIIIVNSFLIAHGMFGLIHNFERNIKHVYFWLDYLGWSSILWSQLIYVIVCFSKIGDVVSVHSVSDTKQK